MPSPTSCGFRRSLFATYARIYAAVNTGSWLSGRSSTWRLSTCTKRFSVTSSRTFVANTSVRSALRRYIHLRRSGARPRGGYRQASALSVRSPFPARLFPARWEEADPALVPTGLAIFDTVPVWHHRSIVTMYASSSMLSRPIVCSRTKSSSHCRPLIIHRMAAPSSSSKGHRSKSGNSSLHTRAAGSRGTQCSGSGCPMT